MPVALWLVAQNLTATNLETNQKQTATSTKMAATGFRAIFNRSYRLTIEAQGFAPLTKANVMWAGLWIFP